MCSMDAETVREMLERHFEYAESDPDAAHRAWTTPVVGDHVDAGCGSLDQVPFNTIGRHVHDLHVVYHRRHRKRPRPAASGPGIPTA